MNGLMKTMATFWKPLVMSSRLTPASRRILCVGGHVASRNNIKTRAMTSSPAISAPAQAVLNTRRSMDVLDSHISYLDTEKGDNVVLFLHGNPTAAFLWRNIIPHVSPIARCVAPDLVGMGHSGKPAIQYRYVEHYAYLKRWIEQMNFPGKISVVCHDWGSGLGFHWCNEHRSRVESIIHMESVAKEIPSWDHFPEVARNIFQALRTEAGEDLVLKKNFFVEQLLTKSIMRTLSDAEMDEYRAPYKEEKSRLPTLTWPRQIPVVSDGPADVVKIASEYSKWLSTSADIPKLYINATPGFFSNTIKTMTQDWPNQKVVEVKGLHFIQEDSPDEIGTEINKFLTELYQK